MYLKKTNNLRNSKDDMMSANSALIDITRAFKQKGGAAMKNARKKILLKFKDDSYSSQALRYFSKVTLHNALPVFPALISMSCEAVGGDVGKTVPLGEAIVLISAAADLHDDVIDQSFVKGSKQTVLGKFNAATSILAGDILLVQGFRQLTEIAEIIPKAQGQEIIKLVSEAVFEICSAEALEVQLSHRFDLNTNEYHEVIRLKAVVPELSMKIGAIVGGGKTKDVKTLGQFGRIYGINSIIFEEFADLLNIEELGSRLKNECPPLPIIYTLQNIKIKTYLLSLLRADPLNEAVHKEIVKTVLDSCELEALQKILISNATAGIKQLPTRVNGKIREEFENMLLVPLKYLET
jgi:geranylgeranyl pyrophosphate synthase